MKWILSVIRKRNIENALQKVQKELEKEKPSYKKISKTIEKVHGSNDNLKQ